MPHPVPNRKQLLNVTHSKVNSLQFMIGFLKTTDVHQKIVVDVSAGSGFVANLWFQAGAHVKAFDKYPQNMEYKHIKCEKIDLDKVLPISSGMADFVLLMETIEHIPDQFVLLQELSRILKPGGMLIITKPNNSNFSGRMANLWLESERSDMFLPNEESLIEFEGGQKYNPRIFLCSIQKLRTMAGFAGLKLDKVYPNQLSISSLLWYLVFGLFFHLRTFLIFGRIVKKISTSLEKLIVKEQYQLNKNHTILLHKHLCITFRKK